MNDFKTLPLLEKAPEWLVVILFGMTCVVGAFVGVLILMWFAAFASGYWIVGTSCVITGYESLCYDGKADMTLASWVLTFTHTIPFICYLGYRLVRNK